MTDFVHVLNLSRRVGAPMRVQLCASFPQRLRGLMFRESLASDSGALLDGGRDSRIDAAIHMLFVRFDLAVFWISAGLHVVDKVVAKPWKLAYLPKAPARYVLELHPAHYPEFDIGERVQIADA